MNDNFEQRTLELAALSPCVKRKVGALIVLQGKVIAEGFNTFNNITNKPCEDVLGFTHPDVIHAEIRALHIAQAKGYKSTDLAGAEIYVSHQPCENCADAILESGIAIINVVNQFMKFDTDKLRYDLIPVEATKGLAEVLTYGAKKYKPNNWQQADDTDRYIAALYRHLEAYRGGEKVDEESQLSHLKHAITNIAFLLYFEEKKQD